ncbi:hypothetical protein SCP_0116030 [Sparassis crispa]|uniref:Sm domain-containing protein n=1 Tax=Sparassis crispa TaxID=139825 RepID=A0A401G974_9APHY|nr:hypothetical protein SCP_0116030 [Sparassis crispa]GBE78712.1 hypothetical protein SCP_0116030 [Sparassis crispa]
MSSATPPSIKQLKSLLRQALRIRILDGRIFLGTFVGTDKQLNILLVNAEEYRIGNDRTDESANGRYVGQILVPWRLISTAEARAGLGIGLGSLDSDDSLYA